MIYLEPILHSYAAGTLQSDNGTLILVLLLLFVLGVWGVLGGLLQLNTPIDALWKRRERMLLARGITPQRDQVWERSAYASAWPRIIFGILLLGVVLVLVVSLSAQPQKMSGFRVDGRELTEEEYEACGKDPVRCTEYIRHKHPPQPKSSKR